MKPRKILITDVDNCALGYSKSKKLLSSFLLEEAKKYDSFAICTHRSALCCFVPSQAEEDSGIRIKNQFYEAATFIKNYSPKETDASDIFLSRVVENIKQETGLECIAVSTPDDNMPSGLVDTIEYRECGWGFKNIIKPIEDKLIKELKDAKGTDIFTHVLEQKDVQELLKKGIAYFLPHTKNNQIKQILKKLHETFPKDNLEVAFVDDLEHMCKSALRLSWDEIQKIAPNVIQFSVYNHNADESTLRAEKIKSIENDLRDFQQSNTPFYVQVQQERIKILKEQNPIVLLGTITATPSLFKRCCACLFPCRKQQSQTAAATHSSPLQSHK